MEKVLHERFQSYLPLVRLDSEIARREYIIAPILLEVALHLKARLRSEFNIEVSDQLKGSLDYLIEAEPNLLVVEATNTDLNNGFTQLVAEVVALDQWTDSPAPVLYGAVTFGEAWRFCRLHRKAKHITQDIETYSVPGAWRNFVGLWLESCKASKPCEANKNHVHFTGRVRINLFAMRA
jgi:hypothetical protein